MASKPGIAIVGAGNVASALAISLHEAGYKVREIISRDRPASLARARRLARQVGARVSRFGFEGPTTQVVWICVPDGVISSCAELLARTSDWKGKIALHASGALPSSELNRLRKKGAAIASAHPLMTFVPEVRPSLKGVPFALEGDRRAVAMARRLVRDLGGDSFLISAATKPAYHAFCGFTSPLLIATLVTAEDVAGKAGITPKLARQRMEPIVRQTLANYFRKSPARAFSGPIIRGDAGTIAKHLKVLSKLPEARQVYLALAQVALKSLPAKNHKHLKRILEE